MYDVTILGGGIVGLASAYQLSLKNPALKILVIEKESHVAMHQTGRNSGVIHTGIYYKPGSLKAQNCREGRLQLIRFCAEEEIPYEVCGKIIVATEQRELGSLQTIFERGQANGVRCNMIAADRIRELEPHCAGIKGIHVPDAGIVDYRVVAERLMIRFLERGGQIILGSKFIGSSLMPKGIIVRHEQGEVESAYLINCCGLHSDRVAANCGHEPEGRIIPFRGEYFTLKPEATRLVKDLIYPVPQLEFPFLGVHFTRMVGGGVECGPNAVLAFAREGYHRTDIDLKELLSIFKFSGFRSLAKRYWKVGLGEMWRSISKSAFTRALQRLVPDIREEHLVPADAGIRAQAILPNGSLVDDFMIVNSERTMHVLNAPSPAATSCLSIGAEIVRRGGF
jgi:L-2-hydroxyglutarate oxidase